MLKNFLAGFVTSIGVCASAGALIIVSGIVDVSAIHGEGPQDRILQYASTRSIRHHATEERNPLADDGAALHRGLAHYREMCAPCHGGPGLEPAEFAAGLYPQPPDLASTGVQAFTDGMLYWVISEGVGSTGMPGFGPTHSPQDIWSLVAVVRHLRSLSAEEKQLLTGARPPQPATEKVENKPGDPTRTHRVSITSFKFVPAELEVNEGDVIEWTNADFVAHTATAEDKSFDTGTLDAGGLKRVTARSKGTFPYFCRYHIAMKGKLIVK